MIAGIRCKLRRAFKNRLGQGLVEFVLIAPMLLVLIMGLVEFARAWNIRHVVTDAAREGARNIALYNNSITTDSAIQVMHSAMAAAGMDTSLATITVDDGNHATDSQASVTIEYPYTVGIVQTFLGWLLSDATFTIGSTFVMRNE